MSLISIKINNETTEIEVNSTLADILKNKDLYVSKGTAIAINNTVVAKSKWETTLLSNNDSILIINASQGG